LQAGQVEKIERVEARIGNAAVVVVVAPEAAELVEVGTAGGWSQSAELMGVIGFLWYGCH